MQHSQNIPVITRHADDSDVRLTLMSWVHEHNWTLKLIGNECLTLPVQLNLFRHKHTTR